MQDEVIQALVDNLNRRTEGQGCAVLLPLQLRPARNSDLKAHILALPAVNISKQALEHGSQGEVCSLGSRNNSEASLAAVIPIPVTSHDAVLRIILCVQMVNDELIQTLVVNEGVFLVITPGDKLLSRFMPEDTRLRVHSDGHTKAQVLSDVGSAVDQRQGELWRLLQHPGSVHSSLHLLYHTGSKEVTVRSDTVDEELGIGTVLSILVILHL